VRVEVAVRDVHEIPGANGYIVEAVGFIPAPESQVEMQGSADDPAVPSWAPHQPAAPAFFPDAGLSVTMQLEWRAFGVAKPGLAEFGATFPIEIGLGSVPGQPANRGPVAPTSRRT
jgi:hypothetical protein